MPILEITDVRKSYRTPDGRLACVLDVPALTLDAGQQIAMRGESGSGKTTLLHVIAGILRPDAGVVRVTGENIAAMSEAARDRHRARHLGYIFQTFNLLQGHTALENVRLAMAFGSGVDQARAIDLLKRVGLADRLHYRPSQLSVGQQQRIAIARSLANKPALVLADEPTGNLDRANADAAIDLIRAMCSESNAALLLVSHDERVLQRFDRVLDLASLNRAATAGSPA